MSVKNQQSREVWARNNTWWRINKVCLHRLLAVTFLSLVMRMSSFLLAQGGYHSRGRFISCFQGQRIKEVGRAESEFLASIISSNSLSLKYLMCSSAMFWGSMSWTPWIVSIFGFAGNRVSSSTHLWSWKHPEPIGNQTGMAGFGPQPIICPSLACSLRCPVIAHHLFLPCGLLLWMEWCEFCMWLNFFCYPSCSQKNLF